MSTTTTRRCVGSARFGIKPHEAPISTFPKQPSRKDGLGTMCAEHWKAYVKGLAADRKAKGGEPAATAKPKADKPSAKAAEVAKAETLLAEVDALPGEQNVKRVGDEDVQRAFETVAASRGVSMEA